MRIYIISGLGADKRIFKLLTFSTGYIIEHIEWKEPYNDESIGRYCKRLSSQIKTDEPYILIGMSFGGMVAVELNKILQPRCTIIISSVSTIQEFPVTFKLIKLLQLHRAIPSKLLKTPSFIANWYFGIKNKEEKEMLHYFMKTVSNKYLKWAVDRIINWENTFKPDQLFHIHGTKDRIFPYRDTNADYLVKGGGHLMVYDRAPDVSRFINDIIKKMNPE